MSVSSTNIIKIGILSLTEHNDIEQFTQRHAKPEIIFCNTKLEFGDLKNFKPPREWNAVILLHSVKLGRLSLTDVPDARYDKLLEDLCKAYNGTEAIGKAICVIAHEVKNFRENSREEQLLNLENSQGSAFKYSGNVIICDTLINLHNTDLEILENFFGKVYRGVTGKELENTEPDVGQEHGANQNEDTVTGTTVTTANGRLFNIRIFLCCWLICIFLAALLAAMAATLTNQHVQQH